MPSRRKRTRSGRAAAQLPLVAVAVAACGLALATGCLSSPEHDGIPVDVLSGHRHSDFCGHYYYPFQWYFVKDHHHGEGCGHVFSYGQWTIE